MRPVVKLSPACHPPLGCSGCCTATLVQIRRTKVQSLQHQLPDIHGAEVLHRAGKPACDGLHNWKAAQP